MSTPPKPPAGTPGGDLDPRIQQARPGWALFILAAPIVLFVIVALLYTGMIGLGLQGRGSGEPVDLRVGGCAEAPAAVVERLADMGLPATIDASDPQLVHTHRIGRPEVDATLAATLAQRGVFELRHDDEVLVTNAQITEATYRLDGMMDPWLLLLLDDVATEAVVGAMRGDPTGRLTFVLDGEPVAMQPNRRDVFRGEVEGIPLADRDAATRMERIAAWSVMIDHVLPCDATVEEVR